jgi:hypothetical protein
MRFTSLKFSFAVLALATVSTAISTTARAWEQPGWDGKRHISYQQQKDLWSRTNVRYGTACLRCQENWFDMHFPMTNNMWALHNDFYYPGVRF